MGKQIDLLDCILSSWRELVEIYIAKSRRWGLLFMKWGEGILPKHLNISFGHFGMFWHEADVVAYLSAKLNECISKRNYTEVEIHVNYKLNPQNFRNDEILYKKLVNAIKDLRNHGIIRKTKFPEIDIIVSDLEKSNFILCLEIKYFHYDPRSKYKDLVGHLLRKVSILRSLKENEVCSVIGILVLDDYLCRISPTIYSQIRSFINNNRSCDMISEYKCVTYEELMQAYSTHIKKFKNENSQLHH
ncbi:MAG: hypothetical protein QXP02_02425 [Desulfurococcaceae archaeon]